jgi:hypothetical protein
MFLLGDVSGDDVVDLPYLSLLAVLTDSCIAGSPWNYNVKLGESRWVIRPEGLVHELRWNRGLLFCRLPD